MTAQVSFQIDEQLPADVACMALLCLVMARYRTVGGMTRRQEDAVCAWFHHRFPDHTNRVLRNEKEEI